MSLAECVAGAEENILEKINTESGKCHFNEEICRKKNSNILIVSLRFFFNTWVYF